MRRPGHQLVGYHGNVGDPFILSDSSFLIHIPSVNLSIRHPTRALRHSSCSSNLVCCILSYLWTVLPILYNLVLRVFYEWRPASWLWLFGSSYSTSCIISLKVSHVATTLPHIILIVHRLQNSPTYHSVPFPVATILTAPPFQTCGLGFPLQLYQLLFKHILLYPFTYLSLPPLVERFPSLRFSATFALYHYNPFVHMFCLPLMLSLLSR